MGGAAALAAGSDGAMVWGKATGADPVGRCYAQSCQPDQPIRAPGRQRAVPLGWEGRCGGRFASQTAPHLRSDPARVLRAPTPP